jgi:hypothetical protein
MSAAMRRELDEELCRRYPEMFRDRHGDPEKSAMPRGLECGDGWFNLIDLLCASLQER